MCLSHANGILAWSSVNTLCLKLQSKVYISWKKLKVVKYGTQCLQMLMTMKKCLGIKNKLRTRVKPGYNDYHCDSKIVAVVDRWSLFRGYLCIKKAQNLAK